MAGEESWAGFHGESKAVQAARSDPGLQYFSGGLLHLLHQSVDARIFSPLHLAVPSRDNVQPNDYYLMVLFAVETRRIRRDRFFCLAQKAKSSVNSPCLPSY